MNSTLHICNGAATAGTLRKIDSAQSIAFWNEALYLGPLSQVNDHEFTELRRQWWKERNASHEPNWSLWHENQHRVFSSLTEAIPVLEQFSRIVLWFEFDLYDQSMLWYILHTLEPYSSIVSKLSIITLDSFPGIDTFRGLGQLNTSQLTTLVGSEVPITTQQVHDAVQCWDAYASGSESQMRALLSQDLSLPYAHRALEARIAQFPDSNGLSDIARSLLTRIHERGPSKVYTIIGVMLAEYNPNYGVSDRVVLDELQSLTAHPSDPISLTINGIPTVWDEANLRDCRVTITEAGIKLLR
jgi:hypothetical protein